MSDLIGNISLRVRNWAMLHAGPPVSGQELESGARAEDHAACQEGWDIGALQPEGREGGVGGPGSLEG